MGRLTRRRSALDGPADLVREVALRLETAEVEHPLVMRSVGGVAEPEAAMEVRQLRHGPLEVVRAERCGAPSESQLQFDVFG